LRRRDFIKQSLVSAGLLSWSPEHIGAFARILAQQATPPQASSEHFRDLAEYEEAQHPLLAGHFDEALRVLIPEVKTRPGVVPYAIAAIYLRMERYEEGIPYARQACQDSPDDIRYRWMLRTLTLHSGQAEKTIQESFRLKVPPAAPATFQFSDVTTNSGAGRLALGRGAAWGDFDNDGSDDILVGAERAPFRLLRNRKDGTFEDVAQNLGLVDPEGLGCYASQFVDYDNDGFQDIFLTSNGWGGGGRLFLFHNDRGKRFTDVTRAAGLAEPVNAFGSSWADYDNDGLVDLAVAAGIVDPAAGDRIRLYHNEGNGKFREIGEQAGLLQKARWISVCWGDYDGDGRQDLLATSYDAGPFLFRNLGHGSFEDVSGRCGIRSSQHAYTCEFLDFDNDGKLDIFVSTYPEGDYKTMIDSKISRSVADHSQHQLLFRNNGDGTFRNITEAAAITGWFGAMSSQNGDLDNDGFEEILLGTGNPALDWCEPKVILHNNGKNQFTDVAESSKLVHFGMLHGMALSDYDDSGNLSLFGSFGGFYWGSRETSRLYRNSGSGNNSLEIRLVGTRSNRDAIGAKITALAGQGTIHKWVNGGTGFGSGNSRCVHLGVAREKKVKHLQIDWPSGVRQSFQFIDAGQRIEITEGQNHWRSLVRFPIRFSRLCLSKTSKRLRGRELYFL
jgi:ASPIC and UnbV/FG-GAP-like repeat